MCRIKHPKPAKTLTRPIPVVPCQTIPSSDPVPRNLQHRQTSEKLPRLQKLVASPLVTEHLTGRCRLRKRYRPPKHRRKLRPTAKQTQGKHICVDTRARTMFLRGPACKFQLHKNTTWNATTLPRPHSTDTSTATGKLWHARWRKLTGDYDPVFCSTTVCRQVALWATTVLEAYMCTHLRMTQSITAPAQMRRKQKPKAFQDSAGPTLPRWTVQSDAKL